MGHLSAPLDGGKQNSCGSLFVFVYLFVWFGIVFCVCTCMCICPFMLMCMCVSAWLEPRLFAGMIVIVEKVTKKDIMKTYFKLSKFSNIAKFKLQSLS